LKPDGVVRAASAANPDSWSRPYGGTPKSGFSPTFPLREETFEREARPGGSVPLRFIETLVSGADLAGKWEILSYLEGKGH
jgi:hypothetical protein